MYIYQRSKWPSFSWNQEKILELLSTVKFSQGMLLGKMGNLGFELKDEATLNVLTEDVLKSSEIEGETLDKKQVRSSIARRLGLETDMNIHVERNVDGIVELLLDATRHYNKPISKERLLGWQASLFPTGYSGIHKIKSGRFRDDKDGPMRVISGPVGKEKIHYQAPDAASIEMEIKHFINWFNASTELDGVVKSGIAHLWFVTIHPFEDGNGRIARALTDMLLAQFERSDKRFYSMSSQIQKNRQSYYDILEKTQKGSLDITDWLIWYLECVQSAIEGTGDILSVVFTKAHFWQKFSGIMFNDRQRKVLNKFLDGFEGNLTSSKWARITKTSQDSANRDISDMINKNVLISAGGGRSSHYVLNI